MRLAHRLPDGCTQREHLQANARNGQPHPDLLVKVPAGGQSLWDAYVGISAGRPASLGGGALVPPSEYVAWQHLQGVRLTPWEVDTLQAMDRASVAQVAKLQPKKAKP